MYVREREGLSQWILLKKDKIYKNDSHEINCNE